MADIAYVAKKPMCDIHKFEHGVTDIEADYDGATTHGPWAFMCQDDFERYGVGLGTGKGQKLVVKE